MNAIFGDQFYRQYILELFVKELASAVGFENLFFTILPGHILYIECLFGHSYGRTYKTLLSSKSRCTEAVFHLNNRLNAAVNLKKEHSIRIYIKNTSVLALKTSKRGVGVYFGMPCYGYVLNCLIIPGTRPLFKRKQKLFILFTCNLEK